MALVQFSHVNVYIQDRWNALDGLRLAVLFRNECRVPLDLLSHTALNYPNLLVFFGT